MSYNNFLANLWCPPPHWSSSLMLLTLYFLSLNLLSQSSFSYFHSFVAIFLLSDHYLELSYAISCHKYILFFDLITSQSIIFMVLLCHYNILLFRSFDFQVLWLWLENYAHDYCFFRCINPRNKLDTMCITQFIVFASLISPYFFHMKNLIAHFLVPHISSIHIFISYASLSDSSYIPSTPITGLSHSLHYFIHIILCSFIGLVSKKKMHNWLTSLDCNATQSYYNHSHIESQDQQDLLKLSFSNLVCLCTFPIIGNNVTLLISYLSMSLTPHSSQLSCI